MHPSDLAYAAVLRVAPAMLRAAAPFSRKVRRGLEGRAATLPSLTAWADAERDPARPLVWLHAPSVGEALMAQAILQAVRARAPDAQFVFTHFSPSAERMAARVGADWAGYLPWDRPDDVDVALDALDPSVIAFVRTEIWPVLLMRARSRHVRVVLVNAVLGKGSTRLRMPARLLLGRAYRRLDGIGAVSGEDAARFALLRVSRSLVQLTGDARFDQVHRRVQSVDRNGALLRPFRAHSRWLVAGSTWPADEQRLVPALRAARAQGAPWRAVMAPHEPTSQHVQQLERSLDQAGLRHMRLPADRADALPHDRDVVVVDRVGALADLYAIAALAYVGGGFGSAGLHSVIEPAAFGVPVLCGPRHGNAQEAARLTRTGGGVVVEGREALQRTLIRFHEDDALRQRTSNAAREFVRLHIGGAARNAALIIEHLDAFQAMRRWQRR